MTQTQSDGDRGGGSTTTNTTRRGFVRLGLGATAAAAAGIGAGSSPATAQVLQTTGGGTNPVSYLTGRLKDHFGFLGDSSSYDKTAAESFYLQARQDHTFIRESNLQVLTSVQNLSQNASQVAYQEARVAALQALNNGNTPTEAISAGQQAVTDYIIPNQKNLVDRFSTAATHIEMIYNRAQDSSVVDPADLWDGINGFPTNSYTLADGSTYDYIGIDKSSAGEKLQGTINTVLLLGNVPYTSESYDDIGAMRATKFQSVLSSLETAHSEAQSNISKFINGIKDKYNAGDISTEDLTQPSDFYGMASEDSENPYAAADLAGLGLEVNQTSSVIIKLLDTDEQIEGSVYLSKSPIGKSLTVGNVYDPSLSRTTDTDGNYTDSESDYAGDSSDPYPIDGLAYIAYNTDSGSTYDQIQQPFEVVNAFNEDGEELQNVGYEPSKGQQTTTTDIDELREELQAMNEEIIRLEEERRELATGGGGGIFGGSGDGGIIAAAAAAGALLFVVLGGGSS